MKRLIPVLLLSFFFLQCSDGIPEGVLPEEKMVDLLTEIHLVDGYANTLHSDSVLVKTPSLYKSVFKKYQADTAQLKHSLEYYAKKPDQIKEIYAKVTKKLENLQKAEQKRQDDKRKKIEKARQDSIKKVNDKKRKEELQKKFKEKKIMQKDSIKRQEIKKRNDLSGERKR